MRYTFEECDRIYCISNTYKNTNAGKGWSITIGSPGQFTPVWGGHLDRFLQFDELVGVYKRLDVNDAIANNRGPELLNDTVVNELSEKVNAIRNKVVGI